jgi:hypothetical protein
MLPRHKPGRESVEWGGKSPSDSRVYWRLREVAPTLSLLEIYLFVLEIRLENKLENA